MKILFQAFGAKCANNENPLLTGNRRILCKKTDCNFAHTVDVHTLFRETSRHVEKIANSENEIDYDWKPKYLITLLEVRNHSNPFQFHYNPESQVIFLTIYDQIGIVKNFIYSKCSHIRRKVHEAFNVQFYYFLNQFWRNKMMFSGSVSQFSLFCGPVSTNWAAQKF